MNDKTRAEAFTELGEHTARIAAGFGGVWQQARSHQHDPVALDKLALQALTISQALGILAERSQQLAEALLDGED